MRNFHQNLIDCKLHMIIIGVYGPGDKILSCRAMTVELTGLPVDETAVVDLHDDTVELPPPQLLEEIDEWSTTKAGVFKMVVNDDGNAIGIVHADEPWLCPKSNPDFIGVTAPTVINSGGLARRLVSLSSPVLDTMAPGPYQR